MSPSWVLSTHWSAGRLNVVQSDICPRALPSLCEQTGLSDSHAQVCCPPLCATYERLDAQFVEFACVLSSGFVGVCSYARLSGSQHWLSSLVSCLPQSEKWGVSELSGQRGAKRNPADSNKHQQHIVKFTGLRKHASCKAVYQVGRDNTRAGQTRTISHDVCLLYK